MDVSGAVVGLVLSMPLLLPLAVYIKLMSRGPVLYTSKRVGYGDEEFTMYKFRTMEYGGDSDTHSAYMKSLIVGAADDPNGGAPAMQKMIRDPRLIPFSGLIRKTCMDEIPQFINVLLGDMSLVGPRPAIRYETDEYQEWHRSRLRVVPGMTGLWQVSGKNRLTFREMVALDIRYSREKSFFLDLKILVLTLPAILKQIGDWLVERRTKHV